MIEGLRFKVGDIVQYKGEHAKLMAEILDNPIDTVYTVIELIPPTQGNPLAAPDSHEGLDDIEKYDIYYTNKKGVTYAHHAYDYLLELNLPAMRVKKLKEIVND